MADAFKRDKAAIISFYPAYPAERERRYGILLLPD